MRLTSAIVQNERTARSEWRRAWLALFLMPLVLLGFQAPTPRAHISHARPAQRPARGRLGSYGAIGFQETTEQGAAAFRHTAQPALAPASLAEDMPTASPAGGPAAHPDLLRTHRTGASPIALSPAAALPSANRSLAYTAPALLAQISEWALLLASARATAEPRGPPALA